MREIHIDLSNDNHLQQPQIFGGYAGEHNETILQVKLPERMVDIECSGYRFDFQTSEDNKISSPLISISELQQDNIISFRLSQQLTVAGKLLFNIAAIQCDESDESSVSLIAKTNTVSLYIYNSPEGYNTLIDPNGYKDELLKAIDDRILKINPAQVEQEYSSTSQYAQSGTAVAEAIKQITEKAANAIIKNVIINNNFGTNSVNSVRCNDVSPFEHNVKIRLSSETISDFSDVTIKIAGKNLLNVNRTAGTIPQAEYEASNPRIWEYDKYYEKMGTNGIYGYWTNATFEVEDNSVSVTGASGGYGIGFPVKVTPNTTYYFSSVVEDTEETDLRIGFAFYNSNGERLSEQSPTNATINTNWQVITPANCTTVLIVFRPTSTNTITYTLNQFELGEVKTEYEEYKSEQTATANADGTVNGITSISPTMTLMADTECIDIDVEYNADTKLYIDNKFEELKSAILSLGGNI